MAENRARILNNILGSEDLSQLNMKGVDTLNTAKRLPAIMLVDTSTSMRPNARLLKGCVETMYAEILRDEVAGNNVELSVMTFNEDIEILQPMEEIYLQEHMGRNFEFNCIGQTLTGLALREAVRQLEARKKQYKQTGVRYYAPLLFLLSDGIPYSSDARINAENLEALEDSIAYIRQEVRQNALCVVAVEIGDKCDHRLMQQITGSNDRNRLRNLHDSRDFSDFFHWTSSLIISNSRGSNFL